MAFTAVQIAPLAVDRPRATARRETVATVLGADLQGTPTILAVVVAPVVAVLAWTVPFVGPILYTLGAGRRFVAVRYAREKLAAGGNVATDDLADADAALATHRDGDAASAFESAGRLVQGLRDDAHVRNPHLCAHLDALPRACGTAATSASTAQPTTRPPTHPPPVRAPPTRRPTGRAPQARPPPTLDRRFL